MYVIISYWYSDSMEMLGDNYGAELEIPYFLFSVMVGKICNFTRDEILTSKVEVTNYNIILMKK